MPETSGGTAGFYDDLAATYDRLYPDWDAAVREQGEALHRVLLDALGAGPHRVLDAAAGIGTQLLGLAAHGHDLSGVDLSLRAVQRAGEECAHRGIDAHLAVADMRRLPFAAGSVDAVVCADNAVAHLLSLADLVVALAEMRRVTRPGGVVLVSTRDYEHARRDRPPGTVPQVSASGAGRTISFQVWDWHADGEHYDLEHFQLEHREGAWQTTRRAAAYRATTQAELADSARDAGLTEVSWLQPAESGFFQPLLVGRVPG